MASSTHPLSRVKDLFGEALELAPDHCDAFLAARCGDDLELLTAVRALLETHARATGILDRPSGVALPTAELAERPPENVGPYRIESVIGEGGFGTVYAAEQLQPVRRHVAIKVLKPGMDSRQILARFDAERQALALMDHPNIARVLDAGTTTDGRPYFVMELVRGVPVTQYCDERKLSTPRRLELFSTICQAVHHAHQKGVIHRDIKPSNVLVSEQDDKPVPKVIDFGVAKAMQAPLTNLTLHTEIRQLIGTPEYMSPEQAAGHGIDIDTRSDVYSLGVMLYELLTGATPFDSHELRRAALGEMQRMIREVDPPKPSTRISGIATGGDVATRRGTEITRLRSQIRGEIDWIVMKCLEKDRSRRYESAASLAGDIQNHLAGRAVAAGPPTNAYRLKKFVHRHKIGLSAAALVFLALLGGLIATLAALRQAQLERDRAAEARDLARQHVDFVDEMFESIRPEQTRGRQVSVREVLDAAAARVAGSFRDRPMTEAAVRDTFGQAYASIGLFDRAREQLDQGLRLTASPDSSAERALQINIRERLGTIEDQLGNYPRAEELLRGALKDSIAELGPNHIQTLSAKDRLASTLETVNKLSEAEALRKELAVALKDPPPQLARMSLIQNGNYGLLLQVLDRPAEAEALYRETIESGSKLLGPDHPDVIGMKMALGTLLRDRADFPNALVLLEDAWQQSIKIFGADHPNTLIAAHTAGLVMSAAGRSADAEKVLADAAERSKRILGEDHPTTLFTVHDLAQIWMVTRRFEQAEPVMRDLTERMARVFGEDHRDTLMFRGDLARILRSRGAYPEAAEIYREIANRLERTLGPTHNYTLSAKMRYGSTLVLLRNFAEAEPILAFVYETQLKQNQARGEWAAEANYGVCLQNLGKYDESIAPLREAERLIRAYPRLDRVTLREVATSLSASYEATGKAQEAAHYRSIAIEMSKPATQPATRPVQHPVLN